MEVCVHFSPGGRLIIAVLCKGYRQLLLVFLVDISLIMIKLLIDVQKLPHCKMPAGVLIAPVPPTHVRLDVHWLAVFSKQFHFMLKCFSENLCSSGAMSQVSWIKRRRKKKKNNNIEFHSKMKMHGRTPAVGSESAVF